MNEVRIARKREVVVGATAAFTMAGGWKRHAVTAVGPYAAGAIAVGTSMLTHATALETSVLLAEGAAISLLCGALRSSRQRASQCARREAEARRAAEAADRAAEEARVRFRGVFDSADDVMVLVDNDLAVVDVNRAALAFFDRRKEELVGARSDRLVAPQDRAAWQRHWRDLRAVATSRCEVSLLAAGGTPRLFEVNCAPDIGPGLHLSMLRDVDARRRAEQFARFLNEASDVLAGSLDCDSTLSAVVRLAVPQIADWAAVDMLDGDELRRVAVAHADVEKVGPESLFRPRPGGPDAGVARVVRAGVPEISARIGEAPWTEDSQQCDLARAHWERFSSTMCVPLRVQGQSVGAISLARSEARREFRTEDLDFARELAHRASAALENARTFRASQEANRVKDEFLATISHELRTPLNAILGWTTMLRRKPDVDAKKALDTIERNARAQMRLIEDVLDVSRAVTGKLQLETSDLDLIEVLRASLEVVTPMADGRNVTLDVRIEGGPCRMSGDPDRLQQALWNVLTNAIKFTGKGGRVGVRLERTDSRVEVVVADTGRGIAADFLPYVFDRFRQADSSTTRVEGGLGLGLAIVKHIVELHGGTVSAHSRGEGYGTTFTIGLPVQLLASPASVPAGLPKASSGVYLSPGGAERTQGLAGVRVLVCDDDEDARELLVAVLAAAGATTLATSSGGAALDAFRSFGPHVLVSDVGMPHIDGYQLIGQVRAMTEEEGGQTPAIALTAYARREDELKALLAGYQVHVTKPIDPGRLVEIVANLVGRPLLRNRERPGSP